jgi:diguanylate cyclase (GGDEF)-like protein
MEQQRASVLEMVSTHAPLSRSLGSVLELAPAQAGAAVWAVAGPQLQFQAACHLPRALTEQLAQQLLPRTDESSSEWRELEDQRRLLAGQFGLLAAGSRTLRDAGGRVIGMLRVFATGDDIVQPAILEQMGQLAALAIENTLLYERLAFQAQHDTLTELPNRLLFQDRVQQSLQGARRGRKRVALLWIGLDRYKQINDVLGHRAGDEVLSQVARRLRGCLRESDTVARVGGDEFTVLVHDITSPTDAELVCRKILSALSQPMQLGERGVSVTASAGISLFPEHGQDPIALMRHADLAMYSAKRAGGNAQQVFRPALGENLTRRVQIEQALNTALGNKEFSLVFQPLINRAGGVESLEALLRWTSATLGRVSPADFIPIAEEMGLIQAIGEWVTRTACRTGADWMEAGYEVPRIAVNVSAAQSVEKSFAEVVERVLLDTRFPAGKLELEITETALMNNIELALEQMEALRRLGVRFAIDDFGTGYSSLSQLRNLPVDFLKIDRSFVKDLVTAGSDSNTLVRSIITLAHSLKLKVVAEGVETQEQLEVLRAMGCDISQGFFFHRPMPAEEVELLLGRAEQEPAEPELVTTPA